MSGLTFLSVDTGGGTVGDTFDLGGGNLPTSSTDVALEQVAPHPHRGFHDLRALPIMIISHTVMRVFMISTLCDHHAHPHRLEGYVLLFALLHAGVALKWTWDLSGNYTVPNFANIVEGYVLLTLYFTPASH